MKNRTLISVTIFVLPYLLIVFSVPLTSALAQIQTEEFSTFNKLTPDEKVKIFLPCMDKAEHYKEISYDKYEYPVMDYKFQL